MRPNFILAAIVMMVGVSACASSGGSGRSSGGYAVSEGSAIYAGGLFDPKKTDVGISGYYGQYRIRDGDNGDGCCFDKEVEGSGVKPRGALLLVWRASETGDEMIYVENLDFSYPKPINVRHFYAVAQLPDLPAYPAKINRHLLYRAFLSAGKVTVSEQGLRPEDAAQAAAFVMTRGRRRLDRYVFGREDAVYYKVLSVGRDGIEVADDPSPWHVVPGVAISEEQYRELVECSPADDCRSFLSLGDMDLTPEQREYVRMHPITKVDMRELIDSLEHERRRSRREQRRLERWRWQ